MINLLSYTFASKEQQNEVWHLNISAISRKCTRVFYAQVYLQDLQTIGYICMKLVLLALALGSDLVSVLTLQVIQHLPSFEILYFNQHVGHTTVFKAILLFLSLS